MLKGFKNFLMRGNVVDLAVGVMIGASFKTIVDALVADIIMPIVGAVGGTPDFSGISFEINKSVFKIGDFLNAVIGFVIIAGVIYFAIVMPMNHIMAMGKKQEKPAATEKTCDECLSAIPKKSKRCKYCTSVQD